MFEFLCDMTWGEGLTRRIYETREEERLSTKHVMCLENHESSFLFWRNHLFLTVFLSLDSSFISLEARRPETQDLPRNVQTWFTRVEYLQGNPVSEFLTVLPSLHPWNTYFCLKEFDTTRDIREEESRMENQEKALNLYTHHFLQEKRGEGFTEKRDRHQRLPNKMVQKERSNRD
jgi:hypothetical protein